MVRLSISVSLFLLAVVLAVPMEAEAVRPASLRKWEQLVMKRVDSFKSGRVLAEGIDDETAHIQDIKSYYRETLDSSDGWVEGTGIAKTELKMQSYEDEDLSAKSSFRQKTIDGRYIVYLAPRSTNQVLERMVRVLELATGATGQSLRADHIEQFRHVGKGFTATLNKNMVELVRSHPSVVNIEPDVAIHMKFFDVAEPSNDLHVSAWSDEETASIQQTRGSEVPWNLDRLDQRSKILDGLYIPDGTGKGVNVFIVDTGTRYTHLDLEGRAKYFGVDIIDDLTGSNLAGSDCNGHGSHVAGIVGGKTYGVAKEVTIYSVRGLNCNGKGAVSGVVRAFDLIAQFDPSRPKVVSLSLGIEVSKALNAALKRLVLDHGIVAVAAAGNQGSDSCKYSPASSGVTISVGATDAEDEVPSFSNAGSCVDLFAPGRNIMSLSSQCDNCVRAMSGTSMACPHVTGYVAIQLEKQASLTPTEILNKAIGHATKNAIDLDSMSIKKSAYNTPNRLLYVPRAVIEGANPI